jgi:LPXTG-motif cell wall-anchored protein
MANEWYYLIDGVSIGPVDSARLRELRKSGIVTGTTPVWCHELGQWTPVTDPAVRNKLPKTGKPANSFWSTAVAALVAILAFAVAKPIGQLIGSTMSGPTSAASMETLIEAGLSQASKDINKNVPQKLDEITTLTAAFAVGKMIIYRHTLSVKHDQVVVEDFKQQMEVRLAHNVCSTEEMAKLLPHGAIFLYSYFDEDDLKVADIRIAKGACGSTKISR